MREKKFQSLFFYLFLLFFCSLPGFLKGYDNQLAVCTIFKDNAEYFKEWIEFHMLVGVEHFYLYDNSSTDNSLEILDPYIQQGIVTVIDWPNKGGYWVHSTQEAAYNHCGRLASGKTKWVAAIDTDEFLFCEDIENIPDFLQQHDDEAAIFVWWRVYGTSGVLDIPPGYLMIELLYKRFPDNHDRNKQGKLIFKPEELLEFDWAGHRCKLKNNAITYVSKVTDIRINHYVNRTINFFLKQKKQQKEAMDNRNYSDEQWLSHLNDGNDIEDRIMDRFIPVLRKRMGFSND